MEGEFVRKSRREKRRKNPMGNHNNWGMNSALGGNINKIGNQETERRRIEVSRNSSTQNELIRDQLLEKRKIPVEGIKLKDMPEIEITLKHTIKDTFGQIVSDVVEFADQQQLEQDVSHIHYVDSDVNVKNQYLISKTKKNRKLKHKKNRTWKHKSKTDYYTKKIWGYFGDKSDLEINNTSIFKDICRNDIRLRTEAIFEESRDHSRLICSESEIVERNKKIRILLTNLEKEAILNGRLTMAQIEPISDEFIDMLGRTLVQLNYKYDENYMENKPEHKDYCMCSICAELAIMNKLMGEYTLSQLVTSYFHFLYSPDYLPTTMIFHYQKSNEYNLQILFKKIERRFKEENKMNNMMIEESKNEIIVENIRRVEIAAPRPINMITQDTKPSETPPLSYQQMVDELFQIKKEKYSDQE